MLLTGMLSGWKGCVSKTEPQFNYTWITCTFMTIWLL